MSETQIFYDDLADHYHLIFEDWETSRKRQAQTLESLIHNLLDGEVNTVLDCACGIGTQALGLAELGFQVTATDLSPNAVEQARSSAVELDLEMAFGVADFRTIANQVLGEFDVVLASDNALSHMLTDQDMRKAVHNLLLKTRPGGLVLIGIRDYDEILKDPPHVTPTRVFDSASGRRIYFQVWDWAVGKEIYDFQLFILESKPDETWQTHVFESTLKAWCREPLVRIFRESGFTNVLWRMPEETGHYSPIMTAIRPVV